MISGIGSALGNFLRKLPQQQQQQQQQEKRGLQAGNLVAANIPGPARDQIKNESQQPSTGKPGTPDPDGLGIA